MAQSVPSASLVPCMQLLPVGWKVADVAVNNGRSVITLDATESGTVVVTLAASCDLAGAAEVTSEQPQARRFVRIDRTARGSSVTRAYVFPGGCVTQRFTTPGPAGPRMSDTASVELGFTTRQQLGQALDQRSNGRLRLDPAPGG
jgi:hypothetical protein